MAPGLEEIYGKDARNLIKCITNLKEGDDSYDKCIEYVISNFCYSRFLDVNRHSVLRSVDGLCRKFLIHSQKKKAEVLESLSRKFVHGEVFKELNVVNTDVQYSLLSLLILLADNPTAINGDYVAMQRIGEDETVDVVGEEEDDVLLPIAYLLEDDQYHEDPLSSSSSLSVCSLQDKSAMEQMVTFLFRFAKDWSDSDDDDDKKLEVCRKEVGGWEDDGIPSSVVLRKEADFGSCIRTEGSGRGWLCRHVQSPYWVGISLDSAASGGGRSSNRNLSSNLHSEWVDHVQQSNILRLSSSVPIELTERKILREALWMLGGRFQLFVFNYIDGKFIVREGVVVSHLTQKCLHRLLATLTDCSSTLVKLRSFVDEFVACSPRSLPGSLRLYCRTYQAYAFALSSLLGEFDGVLCSLERIVVEQRESFSLTMLLERLETWIEMFDILATIHETVLECEPESGALCERVCRLLQELFLALCDNSPKGKDSNSFLLKLFLKIVCPYLEIIDSWVTLGCLSDEYGEFAIGRNEDVSASDEKFWESAVLVKCVCPSFMEPILDLLLVTGKSMELLRSLGKLPEVARCGTRSTLRSLYDVFIERFSCALNDTTVEGEDGVEHVDRSLKASGIPVWKSILAKNFKDNLNRPPTDEDESELLSDVRFDCSPRDLLRSCFATEVSVRCRRTCRMSMAILNEEHRLNDDLISIRRFWLMEAGDVMFHFYSQVFEKISREDIWSEESNLVIILDDVLSTFSPRDLSRITVRLDENVVDECVRPINCYDGIRLYYRDRWPLDLVVSRTMWDVYDSIFTFLLQVKWAKYCLDELWFSELEGRDDVVVSLKEIHVARMKLLVFVNSFHDWLMTVLCATNGSTSWKESSNLQDTMDEHGRYLVLIQERCLLNSNAQVVHVAICNVLNTAVVFHDLWTGMNAKRSFSLEFLADIENDLRSCMRFLFGLVQNTTSSTLSQRFLLHGESLVSALGGSFLLSDVSNSE